MDFADDEHAARVAEIAVLDHGDVDVERIAVLERLVAGDAVADHVVDGNASRLRVRRIARRLIVERRRYGALDIEHVLVAQAVQFTGGGTGCDKRRDVVEHLACEAAGNAHLRDVVFVLDRNGHGGAQHLLAKRQ